MEGRGSMTLKEAIEKAGKGGKIMRERESGSLRALDVSAIRDYQASRFTYNDVTADDWEVVEGRPIIEVGDTVAAKGCPQDCKVLAISGFMYALQCETGVMTCVCNSLLDIIKLIRKGPKQHVFEGVRLNKGAIASYTGDKFVRFSPDKTYRMTLTEMED